MAEKIIFNVFDPTIKLDEISIDDVEYGTKPSRPEPTGQERKYSKIVGDLFPFISINGMPFTQSVIEYVELDYTDFLPQITAVLNEKGGIFQSGFYPKDGDILSIYIRSRNSDFKPIRQDFEICDCYSPQPNDEAGDTTSFVIFGVLSLKDAFTDKINSFRDQTSIETLKTIAKELKLGFATNETQVNDSMTRVCPYIPYYDFILNDVLPSAYKDDSSFYNCYIDPFYYLNFVDVNSMIVTKRDFDEITTTFFTEMDHNETDPVDKELSKLVKPLVLSNSKEHSGGTEHQIKTFAPVNRSGSISLRNGYREFIQYFDKDKESFEQYFIETLNSEGSEDKIILKDRADKDHTKHVKTINFGTQMGSNVHKNFTHAKLQNKYNNDEIKKMMLMVEMKSINTSIYRSQIVPIVITTDQSNEIRSKVNDAKNEGTSYDKFMSGFYHVSGIKHVWSRSSGEFNTRYLCSKREFENIYKDL